MVSKERIKPGTTIKIKTWDEIKENHILDEPQLAHDSICKFLKRNSNKIRVVKKVSLPPKGEMKIFIKEDTSSYLLLSEIKRVVHNIKLNNDLFEL